MCIQPELVAKALFLKLLPREKPFVYKRANAVFQSFSPEQTFNPLTANGSNGSVTAYIKSTYNGSYVYSADPRTINANVSCLALATCLMSYNPRRKRCQIV